MLEREANKDDAFFVYGLKKGLDASNYFDAYFNHYVETIDKYRAFVSCLNYTPEIIMASVESYFGSANVRYAGKKTVGSNPGLKFKLTRDGETTMYFLKANSTIEGTHPDVREIILYLFLRNLGVGPATCYFIPNITESMNVVYIATREV